MKQIVDFEQRIDLAKIGVCRKKTLQGVEINIVPETIGELIEWISNEVGMLTMTEVSRGLPHIWEVRGGSIKIAPNTELIDALVELCIKINEK